MEPTAQEKQLAMISHIAGPIAMVISAGTLSWLVPLIIYLMKKNESRFVAFHSLQAVILHAIVFLISIVLGILTVVSCGIGAVLTIPIGIVLMVGVFALGIIAGIRANEGQLYMLPIAGEYARKSLGM